MTVIFRDTFQGAAGAITGHTPDTPPGLAYQTTAVYDPDNIVYDKPVLTGGGGATQPTLGMGVLTGAVPTVLTGLSVYVVAEFEWAIGAASPAPLRLGFTQAGRGGDWAITVCPDGYSDGFSVRNANVTAPYGPGGVLGQLVTGVSFPVGTKLRVGILFDMATTTWTAYKDDVAFASDNYGSDVTVGTNDTYGVIEGMGDGLTLSLMEFGTGVMPTIPKPARTPGTTLYKITGTNYTPGTPGSAGYPGTPGTPARVVWVTKDTGKWVLQYNPFGASAAYVSIIDVGNGAAPANYSWVWMPGVKTTSLISYPAVSAVAPIPAVIATPARFVQDFNLGWTGRASSIAYMKGEGAFEFGIPTSNVGSVVGLSSAPQNSGYSDIQFGFYAARGGLEIYEYGASKANIGGYQSDDVFKIRRIGGEIEYVINNEVVYTSNLTSNLTLFLTAALYSGGDAVLDASFGSVASGIAELEALEASAGEGGYTAASGTAAMLRLEGVAHSLFTRGAGKLKTLSAIGGKKYSAASSLMVAFTGVASGFETLPYSLSSNATQPMISYASGLAGSVGAGSALMRGLSSFAADGPSASAEGSMQAMGGFAFTYELPTEATIFSGAYATNLLAPDVSVFVVMNSAGVVTGLLTAQPLVDGLVNSAAIMSGQVEPQLTIEAIMTALATAKNLNFEDGAPTVWALNTKSGGTTRYENYGFNSFAKIGKDYFGVKTDGLYKLSGASDAGTPIPASVNLGKSDFGTSLQKSLNQCYVGVASNGAVVLKVVANGQTFVYSARSSSTNLETQRIDLGRGFKANFFELELQNTAGGAFELATIEFTPVPLSRRI